MGKKRIEAKNKNKIFAIIFCIVFAVCTFISFILVVATRGTSLSYTLFRPNETLNQDFFMDFFNSIRDASRMDVYERGIIYPPLANLLFLFFSKFISHELTETTFYTRYEMQTNQRAIMVYLIFAFLCVVIFALITKVYLKKNQVSNGLAEVLSFIFLMFYPTYYCIERGNIILLAMIATAFFVFFHDSKNKNVQDAAMLSLAFAAAIKIYPAIFGLLYLVEKKYYSALKTIGYGIFLFFVPFLFYNHGQSFILFVQNLIQFNSENKSFYQADSVSILNFFYYLSDKYVVIGQIFFVLIELLSIVALFYVPKKWQRYALLSIMLLNIQSISSSYSMVFMIIPLFAFLADKGEKDKIDIIYLIFFCLLLVPLPCLYINHPEWVQGIFSAFHLEVSYNVNRLVGMPVMQLFNFCLFLEALLHAIQLKKQGIPLLSKIISNPKQKKEKSKAKPNNSPLIP